MAVEITPNSSNGPPFTFIKRGGGTVLLRTGYQYTVKEKYKNGTTAWECINRRKNKCGGKITLKDNYYIIAQYIMLANGSRLLVLKGYTFSRNSRIRKGGSRYMCSSAFSKACPAFAHVNAQNVIIHANTNHTHLPTKYYQTINGGTKQEIPKLLIYQDYSFEMNSSSLLKKNNSDANPKARFTYLCTKANITRCKAYLRVNLDGDVLSALIAHNHMPDSKEVIEPDYCMDMEPIPGKSRCTKQQMSFLIDFMLKNQDLSTERSDNSSKSCVELNNKWQMLAFNLAKIGPQKSVKHLQKTWRALKKQARSEIAILADQPRGKGQFLPSEKTCKVFAAMGEPIVGALELKDLADQSKIMSASERPNIFKTMAATKEARSSHEEEESSDTSNRKRCTKAQMTCLVNYMEKNKDFAMSKLRDPSALMKKWWELELIMAAIGPWKSVKHLMGTWKELQEHARKKSMVPAGEERPSSIITKVINIMGLPLVLLAPGETAEDNGYVDQPSEVAPTSNAPDVTTECSDDDEDEDESDEDKDGGNQDEDGSGQDDDDSSGEWPIFEVDSYP